MRPTRSTKYRVYRRSKYEYPTIFSHLEGQAVIVGAVRAKRSVEGQLGRSLRDDVKTSHTWSQWVWKEPHVES